MDRVMVGGAGGSSGTGVNSFDATDGVDEVALAKKSEGGSSITHIKSIVSELSGLHFVLVGTAITQIAFAYFREDQLSIILGCLVNDDFKHLYEICEEGEGNLQKQLFFELSSLKAANRKKLLKSKVSQIVPADLSEIQKEFEALTRVTLKCSEIGYQCFFNRGAIAVEILNRSMAKWGLNSLFESNGLMTDEEAELEKEAYVKMIEEDPIGANIDSNLLTGSALKLGIKKNILKKTMTHVQNKDRAVIRGCKPEQAQMLLQFSQSGPAMRARGELFCQHPLLKELAQFSRMAIYILIFTYKESLLSVSRQAAISAIKNIREQSEMAVFEKMERIALELKEHYTVLELQRTLQYLPLYILLADPKKIDQYFDKFIGKNPTYIEEFPKKIIPSFCAAYGLPFHPEDKLTELKDDVCRRKLAKARARLLELNLQNEGAHEQACGALAHGEKLFVHLWNEWMKPSKIFLEQAHKEYGVRLKLEPSPLRMSRQEEPPTAESLESPIAVASKAVDVNELKRLSLLELGGGTSLWHFFVAHQMLLNQTDLQSCPYDIIEALSMLCIAFENLLSDPSHIMVTVLPEDSAPEDVELVKNMTRLEIFARDVASKDSGTSDAQNIIFLAHQCIKLGNETEDLELLIARYSSFVKSAIAAYHRISSSNPDLIEQTSLLFDIPIKIKDGGSLTIPQEALFQDMVALCGSDPLFEDALLGIQRLYYLLKKDAGPSHHSYQANESLHLMSIIVEKWLVARNVDQTPTFDINTLLSRVPLIDRSLKNWALSLHGHSVEGRYDRHDYKDRPTALSREVIRREEVSVKVSAEPESGWIKVMASDFAESQKAMEDCIVKLHLLLSSTRPPALV